MRIRYERKRDLPHCGSPRRRTILVIDLAIENINFISYAGGNPTQIFQYSHVIDFLLVGLEIHLLRNIHYNALMLSMYVVVFRQMV